jgi:hypothetical protein
MAVRRMQLVSIEISKIIYLTLLNRPGGEMYVPEVAMKFAQRYSFAKSPDIDELANANQPKLFKIGRFQDIQINEFGIYNDGVIITGRCDTDKIDALLTDSLSWLEAEYSYVQSIAAKPEKHYESAIVVKADSDINKTLVTDDKVSKLIDAALHKGGHTSPRFQPSGFILDCDPAYIKSKRKPTRFMIERRLGSPFEENLFYCNAPLRTSDHLEVLRALEAMPDRG